MFNISHIISQKLVNLPKFIKILLQAIFDFFVVFFSLILFKATHTSANLFSDLFFLAIVSSSFALMSFLFGLYNSFVRFFSTPSLLKTLFISILTYMLVLFIETYGEIKPYNWLTSLFFTFSIVAIPRLILRELLGKVRLKNRKKIAIVGNDYESYELFETLKRSQKYEPTCFLTKNTKPLFTKNFSFPELNSSQFLKQNSKLGIDLILAPESTLKKPWFDKLIQSVAISKIPFFKSQGLDNVIGSKNNNVSIAPLSLTDLSIRSPQSPINKLLKRNIVGQSVLVTGGGGSIGSELCKQIFFQAPKEIIVIEANEYNLYQIEQDLLNLLDEVNFKVKISIILCSVLDRSMLEKIFQQNNIDTVFHAAAFKHVPIVEHNPLVSFENNVIGTKNTAELSVKYKVRTFTLISTDKAVNPTNIMGVTKRLAEMFCQSLSKNNKNTTFAIVRFGNVLGSSGSVIPKFEKQIEAGGPITVTHKEIYRYFMSITEAAQLVVQASAMAKSCEVFVLEMGKPINIFDLAKRLCSIRGLSYYCVEEGTFSGDIEIRITGLRDAEKMYEEVLATEKTFSTEHPRIFSAHEKSISLEKLNLIFEEIQNSIKFENSENLKKVFSSLEEVNYYENNMLEFCNNLKKIKEKRVTNRE